VLLSSRKRGFVAAHFPTACDFSHKYTSNSHLHRVEMQRWLFTHDATLSSASLGAKAPDSPKFADAVVTLDDIGVSVQPRTEAERRSSKSSSFKSLDFRDQYRHRWQPDPFEDRLAGPPYLRGWVAQVHQEIEASAIGGWDCATPVRETAGAALPICLSCEGDSVAPDPAVMELLNVQTAPSTEVLAALHLGAESPAGRRDSDNSGTIPRSVPSELSPRA
jgi:hypothetical protein